MEGEHGMWKPEEGEFVLEGAGMGGGKGGKWKDNVPAAPSEVDRKVREKDIKLRNTAVWKDTTFL